MAPARRDFGYVPQVSFDEGLHRLAEAFRESAPRANHTGNRGNTD